MRFKFKVALLVFLGLLIACNETPKEELRIGLNPWPGYEFLYLAKQKKLYSEDKVQFRLVEFSSLGDARRAYERKQIDGILCTLVELQQLRDNPKFSPQVAFLTDFSDGADVLLAKSDIPNLAALKGKRIGAEIASLGVYMLARSLEIGGLKLEDINLIPTDQREMVSALSKDLVDAIITYPPVSIEAPKHAPVHQIFSSSEIPGEVVDIVAFDSDLLNNRSDEVLALVDAFNAALRYAHDHPDEAYEIMGKREGLSKDEFKSALTGVHLLSACEQKALFRPDGPLRKAVETTDAVMRKMGQISGPKRTDDAISATVIMKIPDC